MTAQDRRAGSRGRKAHGQPTRPRGAGRRRAWRRRATAGQAVSHPGQSAWSRAMTPGTSTFASPCPAQRRAVSINSWVHASAGNSRSPAAPGLVPGARNIPNRPAALPSKTLNPRPDRHDRSQPRHRESSATRPLVSSTWRLEPAQRGGHPQRGPPRCTPAVIHPVRGAAAILGGIRSLAMRSSA